MPTIDGFEPSNEKALSGQRGRKPTLRKASLAVLSKAREGLRKHSVGRPTLCLNYGRLDGIGSVQIKTTSNEVVLSVAVPWTATDIVADILESFLHRLQERHVATGPRPVATVDVENDF